MNNEKEINTPEQGDSIDVVLPIVYRTAEFELVAYLKANTDVPVEIVELEPIVDDGRHNARFLFHLIPKTRVPKWIAWVRDETDKYFQGKCLVNPLKLAEERRALRGRIKQRQCELKDESIKGKYENG